jgi:hypothetical protein
MEELFIWCNWLARFWMTTSKNTGNQNWTIFTPLFPQTTSIKCSEAKWHACCFSDNWKKWGRFFKSDSVDTMQEFRSTHSPEKDILWIQEWYHAEIKFNVGQIIQAKLWNVVYCLECYVSIGMAIFVKRKFILLKGKAKIRNRSTICSRTIITIL